MPGIQKMSAFEKDSQRVHMTDETYGYLNKEIDPTYEEPKIVLEPIVCGTKGVPLATNANDVLPYCQFITFALQQRKISKDSLCSMFPSLVSTPYVDRRSFERHRNMASHRFSKLSADKRKEIRSAFQPASPLSGHQFFCEVCSESMKDYNGFKKWWVYQVGSPKVKKRTAVLALEQEVREFKRAQTAHFTHVNVLLRYGTNVSKRTLLMINKILHFNPVSEPVRKRTRQGSKVEIITVTTSINTYNIFINDTTVLYLLFELFSEARNANDVNWTALFKGKEL